MFELKCERDAGEKLLMSCIAGVRKVVVVFLIVLLVPIVGQAMTYTPPASGSGATSTSTTAGQTNVTFITIQENTAGKGAAVYAIDTDTKEVIWLHDSYYKKYFDVDPLDDNDPFHRDGPRLAVERW
jgi:hypothetical protein